MLTNLAVSSRPFSGRLAAEGQAALVTPSTCAASRAMGHPMPRAASIR